MVKEEAFAKLNLNLHIIPHKLSSGLFPVRFINCQIDLHDELYFEKKDSLIEIVCDNPNMPKEKNNLIFKAAHLLREISHKKKGARIILRKNIPIRAGLGGGSSDAAATIKGLLKLWHIKISDDQLLDIAGKLGKDVYYYLKGGVCEIAGDGSKVKKLPLKLPNFRLVIIIPEEEKPSTSWMYWHLNLNQIGQNLKKLDKLKEAIKSENREDILNNLFNDFEREVFYQFPDLIEIKIKLEEAGAKKTLIAGSGLSIVGFFTKESTAVKAASKLKENYKKIIMTKTK